MIIRINLHPARKPKAKSNPAQGVLVVCIILMMAVIIGAFVIANDVDSKTKAAKAQAARIQQEIDETNARIQDSASISNTIASLKELQEILGRLASIRQGPQYVLNELSRLLSNPRDVIARKEATQLGWLLAWEPENVMLTSFKDLGNGLVELRGEARGMEDVEEFWTRLKTSPLFRNIKLIEIKDSKNSMTNEIVQSFIFNADANFNYRTADGRALVDLLTQESAESPQADQNDSQAQGNDQPTEPVNP